MSSQRLQPPKLAVNGLSPIAMSPVTGETESPIDRRRKDLFPRLRTTAHQFKYAWDFYHDKASSSSGTYENRLTLMLADIVTIKTFWEVLNAFPFQNLQLKDSVHFFKRGVKPVWEDPRNVRGGAWTFRVPKGEAEDFFKEILMMGVGEQFADVIQPGDDLCGISMSIRAFTGLISIWNRRSDNDQSRQGILKVVHDTISPKWQPLCTEPKCYYKQHSAHEGFNEATAEVKKAETPSVSEGAIVEAEVTSPEVKEALRREANVSKVTTEK